MVSYTRDYLLTIKQNFSLKGLLFTENVRNENIEMKDFQFVLFPLRKDYLTT